MVPTILGETSLVNSCKHAQPVGFVATGLSELAQWEMELPHELRLTQADSPIQK